MEPCYLKGTLGFALVYQGTGHVSALPMEITAYSDSDWAGDLKKRRSTAAYVLMVAKAAVAWRSKKMPTIYLSSAEAEYAACTETTKEVICQRGFAEGLGMAYSAPTKLYSDSQSAIALTQNPVSHSQTKHVKLKIHYIWQLVERGEVQMHYISIDENQADLLTKPLSQQKHDKHRGALGLRTSNAAS